MKSGAEEERMRKLRAEFSAKYRFLKGKLDEIEARLIRADAAGNKPPIDGPEVPSAQVSPPRRPRLRDIEQEAVRSAIEQALHATNWNRAEVATRLGISYKALLYRMRQCGLSPRKRPVAAQEE